VPEQPEDLAKQLELHVDHVREGRSDEDLVFELLLKSGFTLATPIQELALGDGKAYSIQGGMLVVCLYLMLILSTTPYLCTQDDLLHLLAQTEIFAVLTAGLVFYHLPLNAYSEADDLAMSVCLIIVTILFMATFLREGILFVWAYMCIFYRKYVSKKVDEKEKGTIAALNKKQKLIKEAEEDGGWLPDAEKKDEEEDDDDDDEDEEEEINAIERAENGMGQHTHAHKANEKKKSEVEMGMKQNDKKKLIGHSSSGGDLEEPPLSASSHSSPSSP
jgi:hypothetical protein